MIQITAPSGGSSYIRSEDTQLQVAKTAEEIIMSQLLEPACVAEDFAEFGILDHAYVRRVKRRGSKAVMVYAADGSFLGRFPDRDTAFAALRINDMEPLSVH